MSSFAEPRQLLHPSRPGSVECEKCRDTFHSETRLRRYDGRFLCEPCISAGHCKVCKERMAIDGWDECQPCVLKLFREHPAEYEDCAWVLQHTPEGREIVRLMGGMPESKEYRAERERRRA